MTTSGYGTPSRAHPTIRPRLQTEPVEPEQHQAPSHDYSLFDIRGTVSHIGDAAWTRSKLPTLTFTVSSTRGTNTSELRITVYGDLVHHASTGLESGQRVHVVGNLRQYSFTTDAGYTGVKTELVATDIHLGLPDATY